MKTLLYFIFTSFFVIASFAFALNLSADTKKAGQIKGGAVHEAPEWFKESFLEVQDDVDEATEANKHVLLFFQLNGCPYCDRMLHESFETEPLTGYIKQHFDTIAINVKGDRDIAFNEEISVTEKELSEILKVRATPAILFLNSDNKTVIRVNGYRAPERFRQVLEYVSSKGYEQGTLADYLDKKLAKNIYQLRDSKLFKKEADLSTVKGPLALVFEDGSCFDCNELHDKIMSKPEVQKELSTFTVIRLHVGSGSVITDLEGNRATAKSLAQKYDMTYRPGVLLFDQGKLVRRYDSLLFSYHFKEGFRYVSGGYYKTEDYGSYSEKRTDELLSAGIDIDLGH